MDQYGQSVIEPERFVLNLDLAGDVIRCSCRGSHHGTNQHRECDPREKSSIDCLHPQDLCCYLVPLLTRCAS
jgi:hypothetical protein